MRNFELPGRSPVHGVDGMAATSQPLSTEVAIDVLKSGGNAMDAAIAACAVQCVIEPQSTGIGGDCFCLYAPKGGADIVGFNGSGKAPSGATAAYFQEQGITELERHSPHAVIVPGAIDAWCTLNRDHGRMPLAELLSFAIHYAKDGYPITSRVHRDINKQRDFLQHDANTARLFLPNGVAPVVGHKHRQPELAATLAAIAADGRDAFYTGSIAASMVERLQSLGGLHTLQDFQSTKGDYVTPIATDYRGYTVHECPPNGQGLIALLLLNIMSELPVGDNALDVDRMHLEIEACRQAYAARTRYLADPDFANVPVEDMLSEEYATSLRNAIDPSRVNAPTNSIELPRHHDTVYISVVDKDRNACSFINTLFWPFGGGISDPATGVVFTNRGQGFSLDPDSPNCIEPGKRPLHTIIPGMVTQNGKTVMSFGVMGGEYQAMGHMQFLTRYLDYGMDIQEAQDAPRFMADPVTGQVEMESGVSETKREALRQRGHVVESAENPVGGSQAIAIDWEQGILTGGSDPRKDGCAAGY